MDIQSVYSCMILGGGSLGGGFSGMGIGGGKNQMRRHYYQG